jgi:TolB-like protein
VRTQFGEYAIRDPQSAMSSAAANAVFLSYASQDAEAARRICDALRAAGVEVWFDQSELIGGDAWDAKIRMQIAECALFVPIISASTQARREGYFRLEWKLAAQRTHMIADGTPFLLPVVIDATRDGDALVPVEFKALQWTRLSDADSMRAFPGRVQTLLGAAKTASPARLEVTRPEPPVRRSFRRNVLLVAAVFAVVISVIVVWRPWSANTGIRPGVQPASATASPPAESARLGPKSVVVFPLENLSPDPENAFFTDGVHYEIIATLSAIPDLKVVSRESAVALKGIAGSLAERAGKVGAANVISGSVRRDARNVRIHLELRRARDEALLWQQAYERPLSEGPLALQSDIADKVARALQARNARGNYAGAQFMTKDPRAYDLFLKTQHSNYLDRSTAAAVRHVGDLEKALELDPGYSTAMRMLVTIHLRLRNEIEFDFATRTHHLQRAKHWADTLARVAPGGAGDDALANYFRSVDRDLSRALAHAENAVRALPNDATAHNRLGLVYFSLGRPHDSIPAYKEALALDPLNPVFRTNHLFAITVLRRTEEFMRALNDEPIESMPLRRLESAHSMRFRLTGELSGMVEKFPPDDQLEWFWRARHFADMIPLIDRLAGETRSPIKRWELHLVKVDALRWAKREAEAAKAASELLPLLQAANASGDFDPSLRDLRLASTMVRLKRPDEALPAARRYVEARSESTEPANRWHREAVLAAIYAVLNRPRESCELLAKLLRVPSGVTVPMLKADPTWDHVRTDPAFQALLADPKNSAPL